MTAVEIIKLARQLGEAIEQSEEMGELKELQGKLRDNPETFDLLIRYQGARIDKENKLNEGTTISPEEEKQLSELELELNRNTLMQELYAVQERFDLLMQEVYMTMDEAISGGSCGSDCGSCSGCHA